MTKLYTVNRKSLKQIFTLGISYRKVALYSDESILACPLTISKRGMEISIRFEYLCSQTVTDGLFFFL